MLHSRYQTNLIYRQILVTRGDADLQRIIRRTDELQLQFYFIHLLTVTFGTASSPYLALNNTQSSSS